MGVCRNFRWGGGGGASPKMPPYKDKKGPPHREIIEKRLPHGEKGPHKEIY